jgi:hypothetical protein
MIMPSTNRMESHWIPKQASDMACSTVDHYPLASTFTMFGIGIGVGVALGCLLVETVMPAPAPASLSNRTLDALAQYLPDSVMRTIRS